MAPHKSRFQFHVRTKKGNKKDKKKQAEKQKKTVDVTASGSNDATKVFDENECESTLYEDVQEGVTKDVPSFPKKRVPSTNETKLSGRFNSELGVAVAALGSSVYEEDVTDSPSESLLMQAPLFVPVGEELEEVPVPVPARERSSSSTSFLHAIAKVFAGRKKSSNTEKNKNKDKNKTRSNSEPTPALTKRVPEVKTYEPVSRAAYERTPSPSPPKPRLTHAQTIPCVLVPGAELPSQRPGYRKILPAPHHKYTGYYAVAPGAPQATHVQRGFHVPNSPPSPPFVQRRNNSAAKLLDRDGDAWANWHAKNASPEQRSFARTHTARAGV